MGNTGVDYTQYDPGDYARSSELGSEGQKRVGKMPGGGVGSGYIKREQNNAIDYGQNRSIMPINDSARSELQVAPKFTLQPRQLPSYQIGR